ncbi:MAG: hypothetical protein KJI69_05070 [Patescibacteria group bacterium]|nr:hypothetical protein [Patescibacteria group bacterium]
MSAHTTKTVTRVQAQELIRAVRAKRVMDPLAIMTDEELEEELNRYAYSAKHDDVLGVLYNFQIE